MDEPTASINYAPGWPGIPPTWSSSNKRGVGTATSPVSLVWFTLSHGILDEIYYPRVDMACTRDLGFIVTDGQAFFSEEKRHTTHQVALLAPGVPGFHVVNTDMNGRYQIDKDIISDPKRDVVLQRIKFTPLIGKLSDYHLYVLLAPHLANCGQGNTGTVGDYKGVPMLIAERDATALALASSAPWLKRSVGFVGRSDGWQDLMDHKVLTWNYDRAENGNIALVGEIDLSNLEDNSFILALGFGRNVAEAGHRARTSLLDSFDDACTAYIEGWQALQKTLLNLKPPPKAGLDIYRTSAAVLLTHEAKNLPGGIIASLAIPWGFSKGDDDLGGYHLVWPRDLVETAGGLLAAGAVHSTVRILRFLQVTQDEDGHWPQNMWLDGTPYWDGIQLDETAFPILLTDMVCREGACSEIDLSEFRSMARKAAGFIVRNGPVTQQDRWEEDPGYSPFTLAVEIAALLCGADLADSHGEPDIAKYLRETADIWNDNIERWTYVTGTDLAKQAGVSGYYVRIAPIDTADASSPAKGFVPIKNRPPEQSDAPAVHIVSPDALALVRFGLRAADDPRILNTVKVIDSLLKVDLPTGPSWHRYNGDGYGEHEDGSPFDGTGVGQAWPLLTGERAHYALAAGNVDEATRLLKALESFANEGGLIPEQTWTGPDIPERELFTGKPSGSAMPLVWAHSEYVKLLRSIRDGRVFDMCSQTVQRYQVEKVTSPFTFWRFNHKCDTFEVGRVLRIEVLAPVTIHWSADGWHNSWDVEATDTGLGVYYADLPTSQLLPGTCVYFTFHWHEPDHWEGIDYSIRALPRLPKV
jgi:glucoamylase